MALTRPRAYQIYDLDYKQAVRVVTLSNVTLSGGAPNSVDGVNLSINDRILVTGQSNPVQNGIYYVTALGTGANGTWARSIDTDATGELESGTIVMVTEGSLYADTQWKLTTNDPIVIGVTALTFVQNYLANSISYGQTSFAIASANANATISVAETSNVAVFTTTGANITGTISASGNVSGGNLVVVNGNLTLGNVNTFTSNSAIVGWSYPSVSLSISAAEGTSTGLFFGNAGSSFYVVGTTNDRVFQYNMSSTNMANTGALFGNVSVTAQDGTPNDLFINSTGANMYVLGSTSRAVYQYTMSSPWNITTANYATLSANISAQEATPTGLWFRPDLSTMYMVGTTNSTVYQYTLSTPGNIATASYASKAVSVSTAGSPQAVNLSSDGSRMWVLSLNNSAVYEWVLSTPWDVSTATHTLGNSYSVRIQEGSPTGLYVDLANTKVWVVGQSSDTVFQYNTANSIINQANAVGVQGQFAAQGNAYFNQQAVFLGAVGMESTLAVDSTLTGGGAVTFSTTTGTISIGTSQTTGTTIIGGTGQTGALNLGRSTATQTIAIGNGVTSSGNTKTIDIGTLGAANSNTNINIGPTAGNATVSFLSNAQVSIANTGAAALSVAGNITGGILITGGLITATGNITSTANVAGGNVIATTTVSAPSHIGTIVSVSGNVTGGNLITGGLITATSNITSTANVAGGNVIATTTVSAPSHIGTIVSVTGNVTGGNLITGGLITATGNITSTANVAGGNLVTVGLITATGNINGGNLNAVTGVRAATGYFTGNVDVLGNLNATVGIVYANSGIFYGNAVTGNSAMFAGIPGFTPLGSNVVAQFAGNANSYSQINFENISNGTSASTDFIATADNGTDTTNYVDVGINSSNFNDPVNYPGYGPNDSYVHNHGGNLILNPESAGKTIKLMVGGTANSNVVGNVSSTGLDITGVVTANGNITGGNILTAGLISAAGNVSANYVLGNIYFATGFSASKIFNGVSEVNIGAANGAANISIGGTSNVAVFSSTGLAITGDLSVTGNATLSGNILGDRIQNGTTSFDIQTQNGNANISVASTTNVAVFASTGVFVTGVNSVTGNVTGGNIVTGGLITATGNIITAGNVSAVGNISGNYFVGNGSQLTGLITGNSFGTIVVSGQSNVVADSASDALTLIAGSGIAITTDSGNDSVTISQVGTESIFATGGDMGTVAEAVTVSEDLGLITAAATVEYELGTITTGGILTPSYLLLPSYTVAQLSSLTASPPGQFVYCSNESGGAVPAFSDGTNWRRVTDRAVVS